VAGSAQTAGRKLTVWGAVLGTIASGLATLVLAAGIAPAAAATPPTPAATTPATTPAATTPATTPAAATTLAAPACTAWPRLSSTFLPTYFAAWWDQTAWVAKLDQLKADCVTNVIVQYSADATTRTAYLPIGLAGWGLYAGNPVIADLLSAADLVGGMTVTVGLATNDSWFAQHADPAALAAQALIDNALADVLVALYAAHPSFAGWYLPLEMDSTNFATLTSWQTMAAYYLSVAGHLHALTPTFPVMTSPFFSAAAAGAGGQTPAQWQAMWAYILARAPIDVIVVQDGAGDSNGLAGSLGAAQVTPAQVSTWLAATAAAIAGRSPGHPAVGRRRPVLTAGRPAHADGPDGDRYARRRRIGHHLHFLQLVLPARPGVRRQPAL